MAKKKRKKKRSPTEGNHRSPDSVTIKNEKHLLELVDEYIEERGFYDDAKSFGANSWRDGETNTGGTKQEPNIWKYHIVVSINGFNLWLDRNKDYYHHFINRIENEEYKSEIDTRVRLKLLEHNSRGNSIGHIKNDAYSSWYAQTFEREGIDLTKELKRQEIELKKVDLELKRVELEKAKAELPSSEFEEAASDELAEFLSSLNNPVESSTIE